MANLANAVIVGALLFLGLLTAFWYASEVRSPATLEVTGASANWTETAGGPALEILLTLDNPRRTEVQVERVTVQPWLGNESLLPQSQAPSAAGAVVGGRSEGWVPVQVLLPTDFGSRLWHASASSDGHPSFRVEGTLHILQSVRRHEIPFEWTAEWEDGWPEGLEERLENCPAPGGDGDGSGAGDGDGGPCLASAAAQWTAGGGLRLELTVRNPEGAAATVTNATARLLFADLTVAEGGGPGELRIPAGGEGTLAVVLLPSREGLDAWWPAHAAACERTPSSLRLHLDVTAEEADGNATAEPEKVEVQWTFDGPTVRTLLACGVEP